MKIEGRVYVAIEYVLTLDDGEEVDRSEPGKPLGFIYGENQIIPGLEGKLAGMAAGENAKLVIEAKDGYGEHNPEMIQEIPRSNFPEDMEIQAGMVFRANSPHGPMNIMVKSCDDKVVVGDFNHPLAGKKLNFDVNVKEVREPTPEEIEALSHSCGPAACESCCGGASCDDKH